MLLRNNPNFFNQEKIDDDIEDNIKKKSNKQYYYLSNETIKNEENEENNIKTNKKILMGRGSEDGNNLIYDNSYLFKKNENKENKFQLRKEVQDILEGKYQKKIILEEEPKIKTEYKYVRKKKFIKQSPKKIKPKKKLQNKIKTFQIDDNESEDEEIKKKLEEKKKEEEEERKRQINYEERLNNFFKKIQTLKNQSNDKLGEELDKLIDDQIYNSDYGINRRIESRMNTFLGRLNYYVLQKENY